ncbi:hypothetical protein GCM10009737_14150 [Nocardioides lentus]|uniref:Type II secretion system protein GspF domain-containing protein n=1 Tax=Nocardioides lentus TaxID=338077 RepID=A0ABN2P6V9_9ACTN
MSGAALLCVLATAGLVGLAGPRPARAAGLRRPPAAAGPPPARRDLLRRLRLGWAACAGAGAWAVVPGALAPVAALAVAAVVWTVASRAEPSGARRAREAARRDLAALVDLLAGALVAGAPPGMAVQVVAEALPGPAADRLAAVRLRLDLGVDPAQVWSDLADDPVLAPLGRTLARAHASGASVADGVSRLAEDLDRQARAEIEDRARAVGVRAALPLGVCLLPAFLLLGVVPMVAGLVGGLLR